VAIERSISSDWRESISVASWHEKRGWCWCCSGPWLGYILDKYIGPDWSLETILWGLSVEEILNQTSFCLVSVLTWPLILRSIA